MPALKKKASTTTVPYVPLDSKLKIEEARGKPDSVPTFLSDSPLNYESALVKQKLQDGTAKKGNTLFWLGSIVMALVFALSVAIYFFLLKYS